MERSPPPGSTNDHAQQQQQPFCYQHEQLSYHQQQQHKQLTSQNESAKTEPPYPSHAHSAITTSLSVTMTPAASLPGAPPPLDEEMNHWLVDICAQLGTAEDEPSLQPHQQLQENGRFGSAVATITAALPPQPTALAVSPLSMQFLPEFASSYAAMSSSSSPGSSSSGGEASLPPAVSAFAANPSSNTTNGSCARRARTKKPTTPAATRAPKREPDGDEDGENDGSEPHLTTAEARREKNRLRVRRHYYRKLSQMNDLRAQVSELEDTIQGLRLQNGNGQLLLAGEATTLLADGPVVLSQQQHRMEQFLRQLDDAKRVLETENQQAREVLYQQTQQCMLTRQQLVDESRLLATPFPMPFIVKKRLAPADCDRIWQNTERVLGGLVCRRRPGTFSDGGDGVSGWKTTRAVEDGAFKFVFQKLIFNRTAEQTLDASWAIFKDPHGFAKLYSPTVKMWCSLVQVVDDDNVVLFQEHQSMDKSEVHVVMKTILLASRVKRPGGDYSITLRGLEHEQLLLEDLSVSARDGYEVWNDINCWYVLL